MTKKDCFDDSARSHWPPDDNPGQPPSHVSLPEYIALLPLWSWIASRENKCSKDGRRALLPLDSEFTWLWKYWEIIRWTSKCVEAQGVLRYITRVSLLSTFDERKCMYLIDCITQCIYLEHWPETPPLWMCPAAPVAFIRAEWPGNLSAWNFKAHRSFSFSSLLHSACTSKSSLKQRLKAGVREMLCTSTDRKVETVR